MLQVNLISAASSPFATEFPETAIAGTPGSPVVAPVSRGDLLTIVIRREQPGDHDAIEALAEAAFGPGRFARAAFRLREGVPPDPHLSFVAIDGGGTLVGSVKLTPVRIGERKAHMLGPLMTSPGLRGLGIGRELMNRSLHEAWARGNEYVVLVGDLAFYGKFGFQPIPHGRLRFPGPADPARILGCELVPGVAARYEGRIMRWFD